MPKWKKSDLLLIAAVKKYTALYKRGLRKNAVVKDCWKKVAAEVNEPDFHLFRSLQNYLGSVMLTSREDCQNHLSHFDQEPQNVYSNGIMSLSTRWQKVIEQNENTCRLKWRILRRTYTKAKHSKNASLYRYLSTNTLNFLEPEIRVRRNKASLIKKMSDDELCSDDFDGMVVVTLTNISKDPTELLAQELNLQHSLTTEAQSPLPNEEPCEKNNLKIATKEQSVETTLGLDEKKIDACVTQPVQLKGTIDDEQFKVAVKVEPHTDGIECESSDSYGLLAQSNITIHSLKIETVDNFDTFESSPSKSEPTTDLCKGIKLNRNVTRTYSRKRNV